VDYASANGTATAGSDYTPTRGTLTFAPGVVTQTITVPVSGDRVNEPDETFTVSLSAAINATFAAGTATGTIVNDDGAGVEVRGSHAVYLYQPQAVASIIKKAANGAPLAMNRSESLVTAQR